MAAGDFQVQLISPTEFAKEKIQAVQEYAAAGGPVSRQPFSPTTVCRRHDSTGRPDWLRLAAHCYSDRVLHRRSAGIEQRQHITRFGSLTLIAQLVSVGMVTELGPSHHRTDGRRAQRFRHGQRTWFHDRDRAD